MFRLPWRSRRWRGIGIILLVAPLLAIALVFRLASHARQEAAAEVLTKSEFAFTVGPVDRAASPGVDPITAAPGFRDLAVYKDHRRERALRAILVRQKWHTDPFVPRRYRIAVRGTWFPVHGNPSRFGGAGTVHRDARRRPAGFRWRALSPDPPRRFAPAYDNVSAGVRLRADSARNGTARSSGIRRRPDHRISSAPEGCAHYRHCR